LASSRYSPSGLSASLPAPGGSLGTGGDSAAKRDGRRTTRTLAGNGGGLPFAGSPMAPGTTQQRPKQERTPMSGGQSSRRRAGAASTGKGSDDDR
jgi:hypothetical protein